MTAVSTKQPRRLMAGITRCVRPGRHAIVALFVFFSATVPADAPPTTTELRIAAASTLAATGVLDLLANDFRTNHPGITIRINAVGASETVDLGRNGQADIVITHHRPSEDLLVEEGYGLRHTEIMHDDYVIFGPAKDPLKISRETDLVVVLKKLAENKVRFFAPSEQSGTYKKLNELWQTAGIKADWPGYENTGASNTSTLKQAALFGAYALADMGTYLANRGELSGNIAPLYHNHPSLRNLYSAMVINKTRVPGANQEAAEKFLDYLISDRGQGLMQRYGEIKYGTRLYTPVAHLDPGIVVERVGDELRQKTLVLNLLLGLIGILVTLIMIVLHLVKRFRKAERERRETEERFLLALSGTNDAIWDWNIETDEAYYSSRWKEMLGYVGYDVEIGKDIHEWINRIHPEDRELTLTQLENYLNGTSSAFYSEHRLRTKRGSYIWVLDRGKVLWDNNGKPVRMSGSVTDIDERKLQGDVMEHQSLHDLITDLPNRTLFMDRLQQCLLASKRDQSRLIVLVVNLNRFREINATLGREIGDLALQQVCIRLRDTLRQSDSIARLGGDEFAILLSAVENNDPAIPVRRLIAALAQPMHLHGLSVSVSASFGVALSPEHGSTADGLLQRAYVAMYTAKHNHSDYVVYTQMPAREKWLTSLPHAKHL